MYLYPYTKKMYFLQSKYVYPFVAVSILICIVLQVLWISSMYHSQRKQLDKQIEGIVNEASKLSVYQSVGGEQITNENFREFLLSPQWTQLRNAFDNSKVNGLKSYFEYDITPDSIELKLWFKLMNRSQSRANKQQHTSESYIQSKQDSMSLLAMDSLVKADLAAVGGIHGDFYVLHGYGKDTLLTPSHTIAQIRAADFRSKAYSYNLRHFAKYQLVIPSITRSVIYQLRYFLLSNLIMILIITFAFYFLLRFIRMQHLFTQARIGFISNMTHEFKTPVSTVSLALESIVKYNLHSDKEKLYEYIHMSKIELERLNFMIEKVLNLHTNEGVAIALQTEEVNLPLLIQEVISSLALQCRKRRAHISFENSTEQLLVLGDKIHLSNVFFNVLDNALKYSVKDPLIQITCQLKGKLIILAVKDNGIGIDPIYHKRIFDRFFRVPTFDIHNIKGTGLGLHYVQEIIDRHDGAISVQSNTGTGSTFFIQLPKI